MLSIQNNAQKTERHTSLIQRKPSKIYIPGVREPLQLPAEEYQLPGPEEKPKDPPQFSFLSLLTPLLTAGVSLALRLTLMKNQANSDLVLILMISAAVIHPLTNFINVLVQKKTYQNKLAQRELNYLSRLKSVSGDLDQIDQEQRSILDQAYPDQQGVQAIALARGDDQRLWYRRSGVDSDFLSLRVQIRSSFLHPLKTMIR